MTHFSLTEAIEKLYIDPFPTKKYRSIVRLLKNIPMITEKLYEIRVCCIDDIVTKLEINLDEISQNKKNRFVPTTEVYKMLVQNQTPEKFNAVLVKLLYYIVFKLNKCTTEDAPSIWHDFRELQYCIFVYRKFSTWDNTEMDGLVLMFQNKLVRMVKELNLDNRELKFHLFSVIRRMIMEIGKHPVYTVQTVKYISEEVKNYYDYVKSLNPQNSVNDYVLENHLTYLYILNDIIGGNFLNINQEEGNEVLSDLRSTLKNLTSLNRMSLRETYLCQNVSRMIEVCQLT